MEYRYTAIVLKKREVGETDRIYTFFTREAGKVSSIAKGVRKSQAKLAAALETGSRSDITVVKTRGMGKIAGAVLEQSFPGIRQNFEALRLLLETISIFDRLVEPEEKDEALYTLLNEYLTTLEMLVATGRQDKLTLITEAWLFQLSFHLGYPLQLNVSVVSGEKLAPGERYIMSPSEGGVLGMHEAKGVNDGLVVEVDTIKLLRLFGQHRLMALAKVVVSDKTLAELQRFRTIFLTWIRR